MQSTSTLQKVFLGIFTLPSGKSNLKFPSLQCRIPFSYQQALERSKGKASNKPLIVGYQRMRAEKYCQKTVLD